jgi:multidrug resistance efflux pump
VVREIPYSPGRPVKVGDALVHIEDDSYQATLTAAEAAVSQADSAQAAQVSTATPSWKAPESPRRLSAPKGAQAALTIRHHFP